MPKTIETWQIWHAMRKHLGDQFVITVLGRRNARTVRMYAQDPRFTEDRCKDPLQALHILFEELATYGRGDVARSAIKYLSSAVDDLDPGDAVQPLLATVDQEVLADYAGVADLQHAINAGEPSDVVFDLVEKAKAEIDRTLAKYIKVASREGVSNG
jgi:hypothetical protein